MLTAVGSLRAQTAISSITTTLTTGTASTTNGVTFDNTTLALNTFTTTTGSTYGVDSSVNINNESVYVRRETGATNPDNSSVWYAQNTSNAAQMLAPYATTLGSALLGNNFDRGADNVFANGSKVSDGNVERLDFIFSASGITTTNQMAFAVFDRGAATQHDPFEIAAITGFNSVTGAATYGGNLLMVTTADYNNLSPTTSTNEVGNFNYTLFRYQNDGNTLGSPNYWSADTETGNQGIGGVMITPTALGLASGTTIYGYSLMAADVTDGGNVGNLADWTNATYYPTNSSDATPGAGGIDPAAVNGVLFRVVPEPSTYGAIFTGLAVAAALLRKHRVKVISRAA
jgi:hypothetical protein